MRLALLVALMLFAAPLPAALAQAAFPAMDPAVIDAALCPLLQAQDIPEAMAAYGEVTRRETMEEIFLHIEYVVAGPDFMITYVVTQEMDEDGAVMNQDDMLELGRLEQGLLLFADTAAAREWAWPLGVPTADEPGYLEISGLPLEPGQEYDPLWWKLRVFCPMDQDRVGEGLGCDVLRIFWDESTAAHNAGFCR